MKYYLIKRLCNTKSGLKGFIVIHKKRKNHPSLGATRFRHYGSEKEALADAKNLAFLMTQKSAMAGLPYGGAKGVIIAPKRCSSYQKNKILSAYAEEVDKLGGAFVTGSDIGLDAMDVKKLKKRTRFVIGTKVSPEYYTAVGIILALRIFLKKFFGKPSVKSRTFAIQGLGKTGLNVLKMLAKEKPMRIFVSDTDMKKVREAKKVFKKAEFVLPGKIFEAPVDIFMPCASGSVLNKKNISRLKAKIVLGSANNQLDAVKSGELLREKGIFYAPDYLVNAGGLISVAEEIVSKNPSKHAIMKKISAIPIKLEKIITQNRGSGLLPNIIADKMVAKVFNKWSKDQK